MNRIVNGRGRLTDTHVAEMRAIHEETTRILSRYADSAYVA